MRRIEADIDGTETEKRLFARFRAATADGSAAHLCNFAAFWRRLNPLTGCQDEAVKHAVVALAAAYQLFQHPNEPVIDGFNRGDLEVFTIQQYNRSIERLQSHAGSSASESIRLTLVCCLAFISLETLRGNHEVAVTHLTNGLRILQSLPDSAFDCLADDSILAWPSPGDSLHMPDIIQLFARFELSACFFTHGIQPVISSRGYRTRTFDDGSSDGLFPDAAHARLAMSRFQHDVTARLHEIAIVTEGGASTAAMFWSDPVQQRQQACLLARSARLGALAADFFSPARFGGGTFPDPASSSLSLDLLRFRCAQFLIARTAGGSTAAFDPFQQHYHHTMTVDAHPDNLLPSILHLASRLSTPSQVPQHPHPAARTPMTLHTHLLGPLYLVASHATDCETRAAAVRLLAQILCAAGGAEEGNTATGFGFGYGSASSASGTNVDRIIGVIERVVDGSRSSSGGGLLVLSTDVPRALTGAGCLPGLWDALILR
jgi:hypothetical protein